MMKAHRLRRDGFTCFAAILLLLASVVTLAPVVLMALSSLTEEKVLLQDGYSFFPRAFSTEAYRTLLVQQTSIVGSYVNSVLVTLIGTSVHLVLTLTFAYPLSRADFKYRNLFSFLVFFTMLFNGGVVPSYIMWTRFFSIRNTLWALIVPNYLMSAFNVILCKNYLRQNIPAAVLEAAEIDGAREGTVFVRIVVPLSTPIISTVALFAGIVYWNDWTNGLYYVTSKSLYSIQQLLIQIMNNIQFLNSGRSSAVLGVSFVLPTVSYRMAIAVVGLIPVLIVMPILQKYLVRGMVIGAVKE